MNDAFKDARTIRTPESGWLLTLPVVRCRPAGEYADTLPPPPQKVNTKPQEKSHPLHKITARSARCTSPQSTATRKQGKKMEGCTGTSPVDALAAPSGDVLPPPPQKVNPKPKKTIVKSPHPRILASSTLTPASITPAAATAEQALAKALQQAGTTIANTEQDGECGNHQEGKPCRIHDKHPADWVPLQEPERITAEEARKLLASGQTETDPLGRIVKLDNRMIEHWEENAKSREDINHRLSQLPLMRALINKPAEIWKNGDRLTYLASAIGIDGKKYIVGFSPTGKDDYLETFWPDSKSLGSKRKGDKIYPKTAVAPST